MNIPNIRDTAPMAKLINQSSKLIALLREEIATHGTSFDQELHALRAMSETFKARLAELRDHNTKVLADQAASEKTS